MGNLKICYDRLNGYTDKELTTKELNELGITKYFINKLIEKGKLVRVKRGTYSVKSLTKSIRFFYAFCKRVLDGDYETAYINLTHFYKTRINNNYDMIILLGFMLLKELIGEYHKFDVLKELEESMTSIEIANNEWNNFYQAVMKKDYYAAQKNITDIIEKNLEERNEKGKVAVAMQNLVNKIISIKEDKIKYSGVIEGELLTKRGEYEDAINNNHNNNISKINVSESQNHFNKFLKVYNIDNLEEAMQELALCIKFADPEDERYLFNSELYKMFEKLIAMQKNGDVFNDINIEYNVKEAPINNFNLAIQKGDYQKAIAFMHIIDLNNSITFKIKKELLNEMSKWNKINKEKSKECFQEQVVKTNDVIELTPIVEEQKEKSNLLDESESENDILNQIKDMELSYENIYELIYNREYELAAALVDRDKYRGDLDRLCSMVARLIKQLHNLKKGILKKSNINQLTGNKFKDFYRALNEYNYEYAYGLALEITNTSKDSKEFEVYKLLLEDLKDLYKEVENAQEELSDLNDRENKMSIRDELSREDIEELIAILSKKINLKKILSKPFDRDASLLNLAETTILSLDGRLNDNDLCRVKCDSSIDSEIFIAALEQGDYITGQKIMSFIDWEAFGKKYTLPFLRLAKKLLNIMIDNLRVVTDKTANTDTNESITEEIELKVNELAYEMMSEEERKDMEKALVLHEMRALAKNRHYEEVYQKYLSSDIDYKDPIVLGNLLLIRSLLQNDADELYNQYLNALETNDPDALEYLNEYKEFITQNYMEETESYRQKMLKS